MQSKFKAISTMLGLMVLLTIPSVILVSHETTEQKSHVVADLFTMADMIGQLSISSMVFFESESAYITLKALTAQPHVSHAYLFDKSDNLFASYDRDNETLQDDDIQINHLLPIGYKDIRLLLDQAGQFHFSDKTYLTVFKQIEFESTDEEGKSHLSDLGFMVIKYEMKSLDERAKMVRFVLSLDVILSLLLAFIFVCRYLNPPFCAFRTQTHHQ